MSEDAFSLDSLLNDLDAVVAQPHAPPSVATTKFTPHPPTAKHTHQNPKAKFAVRPGSGQSSPETYERTAGQQMGTRSAQLSTDADENSIDHLLNLTGSPQPRPEIQQKALGQCRMAPFSPVAKTAVASQHPHAPHAASSSNRPTTFFGADLGSRTSHSAHHNAQSLSTGGCEGSGISSPWDSPNSHGSSSTGRKTFGQDGSTGLGILPSAVGHSLQHHSAGASSGEAGNSALFGPLAALPSGSQQGSSSQLFLRGATNVGAGSNSNNNSNTNSGSSATGSLRAVGSLQEAMGAGGFNGGRGGGDKPGSFLPAASLGALGSTLSSGQGAVSASAGTATKLRCSKVVIAGTAVERGRKASSFASVACDNLRCLQCNFRVHWFAGSAWDPSVDYLFLRNTVPNEAKLAARLLRREASCAYCCQCSFADEEGQRELQPQASRGDPQWICAGHY